MRWEEPLNSLQQLAITEAKHGKNRRECEARPEGHVERADGFTTLGEGGPHEARCQQWRCMDCDAVRLIGPLPMPDGEPCGHGTCGVLPEPICDDVCHHAT